MIKTIEPIDTKFEASLLNAMLTRGNYYKYITHIDLKRCYPNTSLLLADYKRYFETYPEDTTVDVGKLYTHFGQDWHVNDLEQHDIDYYRDCVFPAIEAAVNSEYALDAIIARQCADNIVRASTQGLDVSKIRELIDVYEKQLTTDEHKTTHTVDSVNFEVLDKSKGLPWFLPALQNGIMSITEGQFITVSADFGTGKTAFVIGQAVHAFRYLQKRGDKRPVLYFNSEGMPGDVIGRFLSNLYKDKVPGGFEEIVDRAEEIKQKFSSAFDVTGFRCIQLADTPTFAALKSKVQHYNPALIIIDICDKLAPDEDVHNLKKLYDDLRVLASSGYAIIGTTQSGDTSWTNKETGKKENKKWLGDHDLYGSKTGKGGASDTIITIGKEEGSPLRFISVVKKKRGNAVRITCELIDKFSEYKELTW